MKKIITVIILGIMIFCLTACSGVDNATLDGNVQSVDAGASDAAVSQPDSGRISIVTTIFPEYNWVKEIAGDRLADMDVTFLLDNGVDMHSYQPTAEDIMKISTCDMFIYVGGESDEWVEDALSEASNKDVKVINLLETLGDAAKEEEIVEGMEAEEEDEEKADGPEYDEHVWLSLKNARILVAAIAEAMSEIDASGADTYASNAAAYNKKLAALDSRYQAAVDDGSKDTVLFGDRFPFRYLVDDYGLNYYAAFAGCSAETEASFQTVIFLSGKVDELGLGTVLTIEGKDHSIAETVVENTTSKDQKIAVMDSMQSATSRDAVSGTTYISVMEGNLDVLKDALK